MRFKSKPVEIEAKQWDGDWREMCDWASNVSSGSGTGLSYREIENKPSLNIHTLEGVMSVAIGDWVICGTEGEFYPCKNSVFQRKYEPAPELERSGAV